MRATTIAMLCALAACTTPAAQGAPAGADYLVDSHWLCRPGRDDTCSLPLAVAGPAGGAARTVRADPDAPIDCFYIYPTISYDATANSDLQAGPEENRVAQHQLAAFGSACRLFAPMYRQVTLAALRSRFVGPPMQPDRELAYADVRNAWKDYLERDNKGRGVVLIGHSQGARMLADLIAREIEGQPVHKQVVSALLLGSNIAVPRGADVGGTFKATPLCRRADQTGCVIAYATFRADSPPPADALFGRIAANTTGGTDLGAFRVACTNPAALAGGRGTLQAWLPVRENLLGQPTAPEAWGQRPAGASAVFLALPKVAAECVEDGGASFLSVELPAGTPGELTIDGQVLRNWGLHLIDINIALDDLVRIVRQQSRAYAGSR